MTAPELSTAVVLASRQPIPLRDEDQAGGGVETGAQASVFGSAVGAHSDGR